MVGKDDRRLGSRKFPAENYLRSRRVLKVNSNPCSLSACSANSASRASSSIIKIRNFFLISLFPVQRFAFTVSIQRIDPRPQYTSCRQKCACGQGESRAIKTVGHDGEEVAQICNLLDRRIAFCHPSDNARPWEHTEALPIANRRYRTARHRTLYYHSSNCLQAARKFLANAGRQNHGRTESSEDLYNFMILSRHDSVCSSVAAMRAVESVLTGNLTG